jgi:type II secretory pathway pseudopilin PulG
MKRSPQLARAFSLIEVTIALGVAAFSLIAIFGLLVTGTQVNHTATEQSASSDILTAVAADLRATPKTSPVGIATTSPQFSIAIPANPVGVIPPSTLYFNAQGQSSTTLHAGSRYRLVISFLPNGAGSRTATFVDLKMTWPAAANPVTAATSSAEAFVALDRN